MHLIKITANADVSGLWEGKKGRYRELTSVENIRGADWMSGKAHPAPRWAVAVLGSLAISISPPLFFLFNRYSPFETLFPKTNQ